VKSQALLLDPQARHTTPPPEDRTAAPTAREARVKRVSLRVVLASVGLGSVLRIVQYLHHNSYWNDEAALVMNVLHRNYRELLRPLDFAQAAPPLFLWLERFVYRLGGRSEYVLRAPPAVIALLTLPCFALLAWRLLRPAAAAWAVAWFSVNDRIVPQVTEVKQYSADILCSTLLLLAAFGLRRDRTAARRLAIVSLIASVAVWFSFPSAIVYGGILFALLPQVLRQRRGVWTVLACTLPPLLSAALLAPILLTHPPDPYLHQFWAPHFADPRHPATWLAGALFELGDYPFASLGVPVLILATLGAWSLRRQQKGPCVTAILVTLALAVLTSAVRVYPFGGSRVSLYLFPPMFLLLGAAARPWHEHSCAWHARAWWLLPAPLLLLAVSQCALHCVRPVVRSNIRPVAQYVLQHRKPAQAIYLAGAGSLPQTRVSGRNVEFLCYWPRDETNIHRRMTDPAQIRQRQFWVVYSTISTDKRSDIDRLLQRLEKVATPTERFSTGPAGAVLYRLATAPPATQPATAAPR
jgi:hypothetical protein